MYEVVGEGSAAEKVLILGRVLYLEVLSNFLLQGGRLGNLKPGLLQNL